MPVDRTSLQALRNLIEEASLLLETSPDLPQNRTAACREALASALALSDDLLKQQRMTAAAIMGKKGGRSVAAQRGSEYFRQLAAQRKTHGGGRPKKG